MPPKKIDKRGGYVRLPNGKRVTWAEYRQLLREITDEQILEYQRSQGKVKKEP
jgi:hypothetical protein